MSPHVAGVDAFVDAFAQAPRWASAVESCVWLALYLGRRVSANQCERRATRVELLEQTVLARAWNRVCGHLDQVRIVRLLRLVKLQNLLQVVEECVHANRFCLWTTETYAPHLEFLVPKLPNC